MGKAGLVGRGVEGESCTAAKGPAGAASPDTLLFMISVFHLPAGVRGSFWMTAEIGFWEHK